MPKDRFIVIKREDAERYLPKHDQVDLIHIMAQIQEGRYQDEKTRTNFYAVINTDEPYFEEIKNIMKKYGHWEDDDFNIKGISDKYFIGR